MKRLMLAIGCLPALLLLAADERTDPFSGLLKRTVATTGLPEPRSAAAGIERQFGETTYYLKSVDFATADMGWAVGERHWSQVAKRMEGTVLKTTNGGDTWVALNVGMAESFRDVCFVDEDHGWVVGANGAVLRTTDGGSTWMAQSIPAAGDLQSVAFVNPETGWLTAVRPVHYRHFTGEFDDWEASIWHTSDGGRNWTRQSLPREASLLFAIDFADPQNGWAAGAKFSSYSAFGPEHVGVVYHTNDGGQNWSESYATSEGFTFTSIDFADNKTGWAGGFAHSSSYQGTFMFHTADGGATWSGQPGAGGTFIQIRDLEFAGPNRGYAVGTSYIGDGASVWRTLDGGATWEGIKQVNTNPLVVQGLWGVAVAGDRLLAVGDRSFQATSDQPWGPCGTLQSCGVGCGCLFEQSNISPSLILHDVFFANDQRGWAVGSRTFAPHLWGQVILGTADGGRNWQTQYEHAPHPEALFSVHRLEGVHFTDPRNGWAVGRSTRISEAGASGPSVKNRSAILHTADGGANWEEQGSELCETSGCVFTAVQFLDSEKGWALSAKASPPGIGIQLARTLDGGENWEWVDTGVDGTIAVGFGLVQGAMFFADEQNGWVGGWDTVIHTADGGATWTEQSVDCGYPICYLDSNALAFPTQQSGWIAGGSLFHTANGGSLWRVSGPDLDGHYQDVQFADSQTGWVAGDAGTLLRTSDGGSAWTPIATGTGLSLLGLHLPNRQRGWAVGDHGVIIAFEEDPNPLGVPAVTDVANGASFTPGTASGAWTTIFGANLSTTTRLWNASDFDNGNLPTELDGVGVRINGKPAYPYYISPTQINVLAADDPVEGEVTVTVSSRIGATAPVTAHKAAYSPGLFTYSIRGGLYAIAHLPDGTWIGDYTLARELGLTGTMRGARPGDIVTVYGTGFGQTRPASPTGRLLEQPAVLESPVTVRFGRAEAEVLWAGMIGPGLCQFNIRIPDAGFGDHVVVINVGGQRSQNAVVNVAR